MVFLKNGDFLIFNFYTKWINKKSFFEGSKRKEGFFRPKKHGLKKPPWFLSKNGDFLIFSFYAKWIKRKWFLKDLKEKKPF